MKTYFSCFKLKQIYFISSPCTTSFSFLNKPIIKRKLEEVPENAFVLIDATRADFIDKDVIEEVNNFMTQAHLKNIRVEIKASQYKAVHLLFNQPLKAV